MKQREQALSDFRNKTEDGSQERQEAEAEFMKEIHKAEKAFPLIERFKKPRALDRCGEPPKQMRGSLLKTEILMEEVEAKEEVDDDWDAYYEEWSSGWTTSCDIADEPFEWESVDYDSVEQDDSNSLPSSYCTPFYDHWSYVSESARQADREREEERTRRAPNAQVQELDVQADTENGPQEITHITNNGNKPGKPTRGHRETSGMCTDDTNQQRSLSPLVQDNDVRISESHKFDTVPPHLRKQKAATRQNQFDAGCNGSEPFDVFEKRHCFRFQSVMVMTT